MIETDALVIGAGPVGLWAVFELGLQGLHCQVVDTQAQAGGQCVALYGSKPIYDIPGLPVVSGEGLTTALLEQVKPFKPGYHFRQQISALAPLADGRWQIQTETLNQDAGPTFLARVVFIAAGVGAFVPKAPKLADLGTLLGRHVFFETPQADAWPERRVCVLGGEQEAVSAVLALADHARAHPITLLHRREVLQAEPADLAHLSALRAAGRVRLVVGQVQALVHHADQSGTLCALQIDTPQGQLLEMPCETLLIAQGLSPKLGAISQWGLAMHRKQVQVDTANFATSLPGIFAMGDIVDYPGKKKLIVSGFHEATQAAFGAAALLQPQQNAVLQYTTSSTLLHQRLGLGSAPTAAH